ALSTYHLNQSQSSGEGAPARRFASLVLMEPSRRGEAHACRVVLSTPPAPRPPARPARLDGSESIPYTGGATCDRRNRDGDVLEGDHGQLGRIGPLWARLL